VSRTRWLFIPKEEFKQRMARAAKDEPAIVVEVGRGQLVIEAEATLGVDQVNLGQGLESSKE
jgi:hypothetical protein